MDGLGGAFIGFGITLSLLSIWLSLRQISKSLERSAIAHEVSSQELMKLRQHVGKLHALYETYLRSNHVV